MFFLIQYEFYCYICNTYNVNFYILQLALTRLLRYWKDRHDLFGDKYIQPLTLYGMCLHTPYSKFVHILYSNDVFLIYHLQEL